MLPFSMPSRVLQEWNTYQRRTAERSLRWLELKVNAPDAEDLRLATTPAETIYRMNKIRLLRYDTSRHDPALRTPLLLVPSIINKYYVLDLQPGRSLVAYLLDQGFDVWIVDWGEPGPEDRFDALDDYIALYLQRLMYRVRRKTTAPRVTLLGYSIGGLFAAIYTALFPGDVANLVNLAGPIDFAVDSLAHHVTQPRNCDVDALVDAWGNVPGWFIRTTFENLIPNYQARQAVNLWRHLTDETWLQDHLAIRHWLSDNVDFPGEVCRQYIRDCYQRNLLVKGELRLRDCPVHLDAITCPILAIAASHDHIAPPAAVLALYDAVSSRDKQTLVVDDGHVGIVTNRNAPQTWWPELVAWLRSRSTR